MSSETLNKSIDDLIDQVFAEDVEKSIEIAKDAKTKADEVASKAPKGQKDEARGAGRPKQISDVPQTDQDGRRAADYDASISEKGKEKDQEEADQVKEMNQIKARGGQDSSKPKQAPYMKKSISDEEYEELQAFRKAKEDSEVEELKKAEAQKTEDLIKSVVDRTADKVSAKYEGEIEGLKKSLNEQLTITKAMANAPRTAKSITGIEQLEKSIEAPENKGPETLSKAEAGDLAVEAFEKGVITEDEAVEMDSNGYIYNPDSRRRFEAYVEKKYS